MVALELTPDVILGHWMDNSINNTVMCLGSSLREAHAINRDRQKGNASCKRYTINVQ